MELDPQEREGEMGDESPVSHNDEDMSDGEPHSGTEQDDHDSCDEIRRHGILADHNDVLTKLKMQVRDINVRDEFENQRNQLNFPNMNNRPQDSIQFPVPFPFPHPAAAFLPPMAPQPQPPSSGSSHSSEGSASSQHTWSFEEQFKQVRQDRYSKDGYSNAKEDVTVRNILNKYPVEITLTEDDSYLYKQNNLDKTISNRESSHWNMKVDHVKEFAFVKISEIDQYDYPDEPFLKIELSEESAGQFYGKSDKCHDVSEPLGSAELLCCRMANTAGVLEEKNQLYEINDDPKRKEFLDDLFSFMQKRGTPINRLPIMAKSVLDLYELYNLVIARGGLVDVINKKLWQEIIKGLHLPSSITSAAFTLRTQYMKYLYPYECEKRHLSTPAELQAAIDGNRREGRRSSYGQYDTMSRYGYESPNPTHQLNPLSLVSAAQQQQLAARMSSVMSGGISLHNGAHHPSHPPPMNQPMNGGPLPSLPNLAPSEFEARMMEYMKLLNKEMRATTTTPPRQGEMTPPNATSPLTPFEVQQRMNLFNLYNNNQPQIEPQKEPINLSEPTPAIKREPECRESPPPPKRVPKEDDEHRKSLSPASPVHTPSTHIKINSRGDSRNGDNSLVVSMELNGITYQGVLFAQNTQPSSHTAIAS